MDDCFGAWGCLKNENISRADLDRFTDTIENVLNVEKGRRFFRNFMITCEFKDGLRSLDVWEHSERLLGYDESTESISYLNYLREVSNLIKEIKGKPRFVGVRQQLIMARHSEEKENIFECLQLLKLEAMKALAGPYNAFQGEYIPK